MHIDSGKSLCNCFASLFCVAGMLVRAHAGNIAYGGCHVVIFPTYSVCVPSEA